MADAPQRTQFTDWSDRPPGTEGNYRQRAPVSLLAFLGLGQFQFDEETGNLVTRANGTIPAFDPPSRPTTFDDALNPVEPIQNAAPYLRMAQKRDGLHGRPPVILVMSAEGLCPSYQGPMPTISEIGTCTMDCEKLLAVLRRTVAGDRGRNLNKYFQTDHYIVKDHSQHHTGKCGLPATCHDAQHASRMYQFAFHKSVFVNERNMKAHLDTVVWNAQQLGLTEDQKDIGVERDVIIVAWDMKVIEGIFAFYKPEFYMEKGFYQLWEVQPSPFLNNFFRPDISMHDVLHRVGVQTLVNGYSILRNAGNDAAYLATLLTSLAFLNRGQVRQLRIGNALPMIRDLPFINERLLVTENYPPGSAHKPNPEGPEYVRMVYSHDQNQEPLIEL